MPDLSTPMVSRNVYGLMLAFPKVPTFARILKLSSHPSDQSMNGSSESLQPTDAEGKNPHCLSVGNLELPSYLAATSKM